MRSIFINKMGAKWRLSRPAVHLPAADGLLLVEDFPQGIDSGEGVHEHDAEDHCIAGLREKERGSGDEAPANVDGMGKGIPLTLAVVSG